MGYGKETWTINGGHLVLQDWPQGTTLSMIEIKSTAFLATGARASTRVLHGTECPCYWNKVGFVLNFLIPKLGSRQWGKFFRIQVMIDLSWPLVMGLFRTEACG